MKIYKIDVTVNREGKYECSNTWSHRLGTRPYSHRQAVDSGPVRLVHGLVDQKGVGCEAAGCTDFNHNNVDDKHRIDYTAAIMVSNQYVYGHRQRCYKGSHESQPVRIA